MAIPPHGGIMKDPEVQAAITIVVAAMYLAVAKYIDLYFLLNP